MFHNSTSWNERFLTLKAKAPYTFKDEEYLKSAIAANSRKNFSHLEVIGDSLINMVVKTTLGIAHPDWSAGEITQESQQFLQNIDRRSDKESILCQIAGNLGLKEFFLYKALYKGKEGLAYTHAAAVEALVGSVFYDSGHDLETVRIFVLELYQPFGLTHDKTATEEEANDVCMNGFSSLQRKITCLGAY